MEIWVTWGSLAVLAIGAVGSMLLADRMKTKREEHEALHPFPEVEPPRIPKTYRYIDRSELSDACRDDLASLHESVLRREPVDESEARIGDFITAYVEVMKDGKPIVERVTARVLWPRETYVRARVFGMGSAKGPPGTRPSIDVPRSAIAGVGLFTTPALREEPAAEAAA